MPAAEEKTYNIEVDFPEKASSSPELERLWAYSSIDSILCYVIQIGIFF